MMLLLLNNKVLFYDVVKKMAAFTRRKKSCCLIVYKVYFCFGCRNKVSGYLVCLFLSTLDVQKSFLQIRFQMDHHVGEDVNLEKKIVCVCLFRSKNNCFVGKNFVSMKFALDQKIWFANAFQLDRHVGEKGICYLEGLLLVSDIFGNQMLSSKKLVNLEKYIPVCLFLSEKKNVLL